MILNLNENYKGFILKEEQWIEDVNSHAYIFQHEKSGARLLYLKNTDNNKVFSVSFKTPPSDHTGVAHILEHSVLCGSKKYEVKDPFNELAKGSLNTYLNAMTFSDKTMYPIASCNEEDFHNLMDVYLDAVFYPNIYSKKEIFMQEGWRYFFNKEGDLDITGVVYNEMHGALADPDSMLSMELASIFYGDTTYGFESGGDPKYIPELTYEDFIEFHKNCYHPSNSYFYLYGDLDLERALDHINEDYLSQFNKITLSNTIEFTNKIPDEFIVKKTYPAQSEDEEEKGFLAYTFNVGDCTDLKKTTAIQILSHCLLETNASPIKKNLLEAGLCLDVEGWFESSNYEMIFSIIGKSASTDKYKDFEKIIKDTLKEVVETGADKKLIKSCLKRIEFLIKESDYGSTPKGLIYNIRTMKSWLHGKSPFIYLKQLENLNSLKKEDFSWESLIKELFVDNEKANILVFEPEKDKEKVIEKSFREALKEKKNNLTEDEKNKIIQDNKDLDIFQTTVESEEILNQIPILHLNQISKDPVLVDYKVDKINDLGDNKKIYAPMKSHDIVYIKFHFDTKYIPLDLIPYCGLLTELLGRLDTKSYSFEELPLIINDVVGSLSFSNNIFTISNDKYRSFVTLNSKFLFDDFKEAHKLFDEVLFSTDFNNLDNMKKILQSAKVNAENYLLSSPHMLSIYYSNHNLSESALIQELTKGITYVHFLSDICEKLENDSDIIISKLKDVASKIFCKENISISYGCSENYKNQIDEYNNLFVDKLPLSNNEVITLPFTPKEKSTAFYSTMQVQYNILTGNFQKDSIQYNGYFEVLRTILNLEYLWNKVRVQGGAYGAGCGFKRTGNFYFYSYRDPNLEDTYNIYKNLYKELENFQGNEKDMTKYILGTINNFDQPRTNYDLLSDASNLVFSDVSNDDIIQQRKEILSCTKEIIRGFSSLLKDISTSDNFTTIGNNIKIEENKTYFNDIKNLIP